MDFDKVKAIPFFSYTFLDEFEGRLFFQAAGDTSADGRELMIAIVPSMSNEGYAATLDRDDVDLLLSKLKANEYVKFEKHGLSVHPDNRGDPYREGIEFGFDGTYTDIFMETWEVRELTRAIARAFDQADSAPRP